MRTRPLESLLFAAITALTACGGGAGAGGAAAPTEVKGASASEAIDRDPVVLLPSSPVVAGTFDVRAIVDGKTTGGLAGQLVERFFPLGEESGLSPSKDVDRVTFGSYSSQGLDVVAVLSGRFDAAKIEALATNHVQVKGGGFVVASTYADRKLFTVSNVGFTIVSPRTALVGTESGMRRALERMKDGRLSRAFFPWMMETLETKGAAFAVAGDFANQPLTPQSMGPVPISFVKGLKAFRAIGNFAPPGVQVAGTATYGDDASASAGAENLQKLGKLANVFAVATGNLPQLQNLTIAPRSTDVQVTFAIDDASLQGFLARIPQLLGS